MYVKNWFSRHGNHTSKRSLGACIEGICCRTFHSKTVWLIIVLMHIYVFSYLLLLWNKWNGNAHPRQICFNPYDKNTSTDWQQGLKRNRKACTGITVTPRQSITGGLSDGGAIASPSQLYLSTRTPTHTHTLTHTHTPTHRHPPTHTHTPTHTHALTPSACTLNLLFYGWKIILNTTAQSS